MKAVIVMLLFIFFIAAVVIKCQLEEENKEYNEDEIKEMLKEIRREIEYVKSERNQQKISSYEYVVYLGRLAKQMEKLERQVYEKRS